MPSLGVAHSSPGTRACAEKPNNSYMQTVQTLRICSCQFINKKKVEVSKRCWKCRVVVGPGDGCRGKGVGREAGLLLIVQSLWIPIH